MPWSETVILYREMLRTAKQFPTYMYRTYTLRRIRDGFRQNQSLTDPVMVNKLLEEARDSLAVIQRQVTVGNLYKTSQPNVIETVKARKKT